MKVFGIVVGIIMALVLIGFIVYNTIYILKTLKDRKNNKEEK